MKIAIAAGGTGGHFYPGLAVAKELIARGESVTFIIRNGDYVKNLLEREKIPFFEIPAGGFKRSPHPKNLWAGLKITLGAIQCLARFLAARFDALLVMGGYLSVPPAVAAGVLKIPVLLHEQNVRPGLANRLIARLADRVALSFDGSIPYFQAGVVTGNPVRPEFKHLPHVSESRQKFNLDAARFTILVFGGSLGAQRLNEWMAGAVESLASLAGQVQILHFTGKEDPAPVRRRYAQTKFLHYVDGYCHEMPAAYAAADLVVCRAGASTVAELLAVRKPAILVPYPYATENHQKANADVLEWLGAGLILEEKNTDVGKFTGVLKDLLKDKTAIDRMTKAYEKRKEDPFAAAGKIEALIRQLAAK